jgi:glycosyltransferase involved in cell wall biosynthesis
VTVLYDIQGVQSRAHGERGIARYLLESAGALRDAQPTIVERFLLNPDLEVPGSLEPLTSSGLLQFSDRVQVGDASIYHVGSPIELAVPVARLWPRTAQAAGVRLVVTLYDLIPRLFPERYLVDPLTRRRYETRIDLIRRADRILAISAATADDAIAQLGVRPEKVTVVGTGVSEHFGRPADPAASLAAVRAAQPEVQPGYLLYTGGIEPRKNIDGLLAAYAALPEKLRTEHQLVIVCRVLTAERAQLDRQLQRLRIPAGRVIFTGFVPDELLAALYQSTELFVFPSLYEGFGLPVAEAMACGSPVAVSRIPALTELVDEPAAQFDPHDPGSIADTVTRCLTDEELRKKLRATQLPATASWRSVADRTAAAYEEVAAGGRRRRRHRRPRIAYVTPLPPQRSGVADDSFRLIEALGEHAEVHAVADGEAQGGLAPPGVPVVGTRNFLVADGLSGGYDQVFYCLGNSEFHSGALGLLRERPGIVIAHDVRLTGLYGQIAVHHRHLLPGGFKRTLRRMYGGRLPATIGDENGIDFWEASRHGVLMAREAIAHSNAFLVHSDHAAQLARLDAAPEDEHKVEVIPFRYPAPEIVSPPKPVAPEGAVVATFGLVSPAKQTEKLVDAWPFVTDEIPTAKLAIVGSDAETGESARLHDRAARLGVADTVIQTGDLPEDQFHAWISRCAVAVQLRAGSNGESSAVVAQTLAAGAPTIVTAIGSGRELPDTAVVKVDRDVTPRQLADEIIGLLRAPERRASLARAGLELARRNSYARVALLLFERYVTMAGRRAA